MNNSCDSYRYLLETYPCEIHDSDGVRVYARVNDGFAFIGERELLHFWRVRIPSDRNMARKDFSLDRLIQVGSIGCSMYLQQKY